LLWGAHLQVEYMLVPWLCTTGRGWVAHLITVVAALAAIYFIFLCWREWRRFGGGEESNPPPPDKIARPRFSGSIGLMSASLFTLLIIAQHIVAFFWSPCWD
jgi:hypothetical protein